MTIASFRHLLIAASIALPPATALADGEVNLYTTREPGLVRPLLDAFTEDTGITVNTVFVESGLPERVVAEGANSPADILMTVDIGNLADLVAAEVTQPIDSTVLDEAVPENLRDADGRWYALSKRARVLYAAKDLDLDSFTYEDLADPRWEGKICIRSGQHPYNIALFATYLAYHGEAETKAWLEGLKSNLARAVAIKPDIIRTDAVSVGSRVKLKDASGNQITYTLYGPPDADVAAGIINYMTPLGQALMGQSRGDQVRLEISGEVRELEVLDIENSMAAPA